MSWSKEQVDDFLTGETRLGRLATVSRGGDPHVAPIWFRHEGDRLLVHTMEATTKARNARETGKFALTVDKASVPYAGVILTGRVEVLGPDEVDYKELVKELAHNYVGGDMGGPMGEMIAEMPGSHVTLALYPESWESWDYGQQG